MSPLKVLGRGYSIAAKEDGRVIKCADDADIGEHIRIKLMQGELDCTVERKG